jgi:hypothetical protein
VDAVGAGAAGELLLLLVKLWMLLVKLWMLVELLLLAELWIWWSC